MVEGRPVFRWDSAAGGDVRAVAFAAIEAGMAVGVARELGDLVFEPDGTMRFVPVEGLA